MGEGQFQEDSEGLSEKIAFVLRPEWSKVPGHGKIRSKSILGRVSGKEYSSEAGRNSVSLRKKGQGRWQGDRLCQITVQTSESWL